MALNKSFVTNSLALLLTIVGYFSPLWPEALFNTGIFAFSGAITNWLAIYMLFEKVPYLYGSGVIPSRFEEFKTGIRKLIMEQFFTVDNIERFFKENAVNHSASMPIDFAPIVNQLDYDLMYHKLLTTIANSPLGPMLAMFGCEKALEPLKDPFIQKMQETFLEMSADSKFQKNLKASFAHALESKDIIAKVEDIVQKRLDELTPRMVKEIIQEMIRKHLGWLVVWGGVFGGLIGLLTSFIR